MPPNLNHKPLQIRRILPQLEDVSCFFCCHLNVFQTCINALQCLRGQFRPRFFEVFLQETQVEPDLLPSMVDLLVRAFYALIDFVDGTESPDGGFRHREDRDRDRERIH